MSNLEMRIRLLEKRIGPFLQLNSNQALERAIDCEFVMNDCGPFDPAFAHFAQRSHDWLSAAEILETRECK